MAGAGLDPPHLALGEQVEPVATGRLLGDRRRRRRAPPGRRRTATTARSPPSARARRAPSTAVRATGTARGLDLPGCPPSPCAPPRGRRTAASLPASPARPTVVNRSTSCPTPECAPSELRRRRGSRSPPPELVVRTPVRTPPRYTRPPTVRQSLAADDSSDVRRASARDPAWPRPPGRCAHRLVVWRDEHPSIARFRAELEPPGRHRRDRRTARLGAHRRAGRRGARLRGRARSPTACSSTADGSPVLILTSGAHRVDTAKVAGAPPGRSSGPPRTSCAAHRPGDRRGLPDRAPRARCRPTSTRWLRQYDVIWAAAGHPAAVFSHDVRRAARDDRRDRDRGRR